MSDALLHLGASNLLISFGIALVAWAVHAHGRRPWLAHLLWVLVLVKLLTPPLLALPVIPSSLALGTDHSPATAEVRAMRRDVEFAGAPGSQARAPEATAPVSAAGLDEPATPRDAPGSWAVIKTALFVAWAAGTLVVLAITLRRVLRFERLLRATETAVPAEVHRLASGAADRIGLRRCPEVVAVPARLSPMVWWIGGRPRVVLPQSLLDTASPAELRWILGHELAHLARRDHLVRWLELLACALFWWNPVAWWARRSLRINEEVCCDALVLERLEGRPRAYGEALLSVALLLSPPALRPPAVASALHGGGFLERRFKMIVNENRRIRTPRWLAIGVISAAAALLPMGLAVAGNPDYEAVGKRLRAAVGAGELTVEQAQFMLDGLRDREFEMVADEIRGAVRNGEMNPEEGEARIDAARARIFARLTAPEERPRTRFQLRDETRDRLVAALAEGGIERDRQRAVLRELLAVTNRGLDAGSDFRFAPSTRERFEQMRLDESQIDLVEGLSRRLAARARSMATGAEAARHESERHGGEVERLHDHLAAMKEELGRLVEAGRISEIDARQELMVATRVHEMHLRELEAARHQHEMEREHAEREHHELMRRHEMHMHELEMAHRHHEMERAHAERERHESMRRHEMHRRELEAARRHEDGERAQMERRRRELDRMIESGMISERDARRRLEAVERARRAEGREREARRGDAVRGARMEAEMLEIRKALEAAVAAGVVSEREAARKMRAMLSEIEGKRREVAARTVRGQAEKQRAERSAAREARKKDAAEARKALDSKKAKEAKKAAESKPAPKAKRSKKKDQGDAAKAEREMRERIEAYRAAVDRIKTAVDAGEMTEAEAKEKIESLAKRLAGDRA